MRGPEILQKDKPRDLLVGGGGLNLILGAGNSLCLWDLLPIAPMKIIYNSLILIFLARVLGCEMLLFRLKQGPFEIKTFGAVAYYPESGDLFSDMII